MALAILLTGDPGIGKSTVIQKVVEAARLHMQGFYTRERRLNDRRVGFTIVTLDGDRAELASREPHPSFAHSIVFHGYSVNIDAIEQVAIPAIGRMLGLST